MVTDTETTTIRTSKIKRRDGKEKKEYIKTTE